MAKNKQKNNEIITEFDVFYTEKENRRKDKRVANATPARYFVRRFIYNKPPIDARFFLQKFQQKA